MYKCNKRAKKCAQFIYFLYLFTSDSLSEFGLLISVEAIRLFILSIGSIPCADSILMKQIRFNPRVGLFAIFSESFGFFHPVCQLQRFTMMYCHTRGLLSTSSMFSKGPRAELDCYVCFSTKKASEMVHCWNDVVRLAKHTVSNTGHTI